MQCYLAACGRPKGPKCGLLLPFAQRDAAKDPLTFLPVAEDVPGFAQVDSSPVVHDADVAGAAVWGGEGGRVAHSFAI